MNGKVVLYLAIFFATLTFFEVEADKSKNRRAQRTLSVCSPLAEKVAELNQAIYGNLTLVLEINKICLGVVEKNGAV